METEQKRATAHAQIALSAQQTRMTVRKAIIGMASTRTQPTHLGQSCSPIIVHRHVLFLAKFYVHRTFGTSRGLDRHIYECVSSYRIALPYLIHSLAASIFFFLSLAQSFIAWSSQLMQALLGLMSFLLLFELRVYQPGVAVVKTFTAYFSPRGNSLVLLQHREGWQRGLQALKVTSTVLGGALEQHHPRL